MMVSTVGGTLPGWQQQQARMVARRPGLGDAYSTAIATVPVIASGTMAAGTMAGAAWATALIPVIGPVVAGVTLALSLLAARKGPQQKRYTTQIVDAVEPELRRNLDGYLAGPRNRTSQAQALANFDAGWAYVVENCSDPALGNPGQRCISERQAGGRWDWFALYRDPIALDPDVRDDPGINVYGGVIHPIVEGLQDSGMAWLLPVVGGLLIMAAVVK